MVLRQRPDSVSGGQDTAESLRTIAFLTYTRGQPPKAMFYNAIQAYGDEIAKDFGDTVLEVLRDE